MDYLDRLARFVGDTSVRRAAAARRRRRAAGAARHARRDARGQPPARERSAGRPGGRALGAAHGDPDRSRRARRARCSPRSSNATAGVALEVDEGNRWGGGHPSIHVLPGLLAVAEEIGADGRGCWGARRGLRGVVAHGGRHRAAPQRPHPRHVGDGRAPRSPWRSSSSSTRRRSPGHEPRGLDEPGQSWVPCFEGATIRNLYPGRSGLQGVLAVHLHRCGFTAPADAPADIYGAILGERSSPPGRSIASARTTGSRPTTSSCTRAAASTTTRSRRSSDRRRPSLPAEDVEQVP